MGDENYLKLLEKVSRVSGIDKTEIDRRVTAKQAKLSGLISKEGALQVVAAELGINFENEKFKIEELVAGMRKVNTLGKIIRVFPVREFTTKNGEKGKVLNFIIADDTSNIKVVLWDTNHIGLFENGSISEGSVVEISNGSMRMNEVHLGSFSEFKPSNQIFEKVITEKVCSEKTIVNLNIGDSAKVRGFIVQIFEPKVFHVCPECKKKASPEADGFVCVAHGRVLPEKRALVNLVLDDGSGTIRAVLFHDSLSLLGINLSDEAEVSSQKRRALLGKELFFSGNIKMNSYFNNPEFSVDKVEECDVETLLKKFEN
ncbi:hypothetical protein J4474_01775 [Candidatus Pacearchaeota archaeon]|nr:hypothetical protein [Candidatus Pacearchaeota archaeon]